jgi:hypothetical protein
VYSFVAALLVIAIFSGLIWQQDREVIASIQSTSIARMETNAAIEMSEFANAAYAYAQADGVAAGVQITAPTLVAAGFLPASFSATNEFGQTVQAVTGKGYSGSLAVLAYYSAPPTNTLGLANTSQIQSSFSFGIAERLSSVQENSPVYDAAVLTGSGYGSAQMPFSSASSAVDLTSYFSGYTNTFPSVVDMVDVLPSGSTPTASSASSSCTASPTTVTYTGSAQLISAPSGCTKATVTVEGGGGGGSWMDNGGPGSRVIGTIALSTYPQFSVFVGQGGWASVSVSYPGVDAYGGGSGGESYVAIQPNWYTTQYLILAGGGGGAGGANDLNGYGAMPYPAGNGNNDPGAPYTGYESAAPYYSYGGSWSAASDTYWQITGYAGTNLCSSSTHSLPGCGGHGYYGGPPGMPYYYNGTWNEGSGAGMGGTDYVDPSVTNVVDYPGQGGAGGASMLSGANGVVIFSWS